MTQHRSCLQHPEKGCLFLFVFQEKLEVGIVESVSEQKDILSSDTDVDVEDFLEYSTDL